MKNLKLSVLFMSASLTFFGCNQSTESKSDVLKPETVVKSVETSALEKVLQAQPEDVIARYDARHPQETLDFFGVKPGMTVMEALPGGGWYTKILMPYLGSEGKVIGTDYAADMFPLFGFFSPERLEAKKTWVTTWTTEAQSWKKEGSADIGAFQFGSMPETMANSADAVVFIRALHNVARFENEGGYLTKALNDAFRVLKPGGILGVVQHKAPETMTDEWASGARGYLKQTFVIAKMQEVGFEFVASSDINNNPKDQPDAEDIVWRLAPSLSTSREDPKLKEEIQAIGESNRMTLTFKKPES
ncbi:MAG: putative methyltransferase [Flavobacteriales bacterium]|jgi:predicted methyltransferase